MLNITHNITRSSVRLKLAVSSVLPLLLLCSVAAWGATCLTRDVGLVQCGYAKDQTKCDKTIVKTGGNNKANQYHRCEWTYLGYIGYYRCNDSRETCHIDKY